MLHRVGHPIVFAAIAALTTFAGDSPAQDGCKTGVKGLVDTLEHAAEEPPRLRLADIPHQAPTSGVPTMRESLLSIIARDEFGSVHASSDEAVRGASNFAKKRKANGLAMYAVVPQNDVEFANTFR